MTIESPDKTSEMNGFELGTPALVCRWRLSAKRLPLANRHLRALSFRRIDDEPLPKNLVSWAKQHIEWTLESGSYAEPNGVLMVLVDDHFHAAMAVGPYEPLFDRSPAALAERARLSLLEQQQSHVAPETLWLVHKGQLVCSIPEGEAVAGIVSFIFDLARTLGISIQRDSQLIQKVSAHAQGSDDVLLVSDEHGIVVSDGACSTMAHNLFGSYTRLLEQTARR